MSKMTEVEIGKLVIPEIQGCGWTVYEEVEVVSGVADIVAEKEGWYWCVELKTSLSLSLLDQAMERQRWGEFNFVSVAHPSKTISHAAHELLRQRGIGEIRVNQQRTVTFKEPRFTRIKRTKNRSQMLQSLERYKKVSDAGCPGALRWTPFKQTCLYVEKYLRSVGGKAPWKEVMEHVDHHYHGNGYSLVTAVRSGFVKNIELEKIGGRVYLAIVDQNGK